MFRISLKMKSKQNRLIGFSLGAKEDERRMGILFSYQYRTQNSSTGSWSSVCNSYLGGGLNSFYCQRSPIACKDSM